MTSVKVHLYSLKCVFDVHFMVITLHFYLELNAGIRNIFCNIKKYNETR